MRVQLQRAGMVAPNAETTAIPLVAAITLKNAFVLAFILQTESGLCDGAIYTFSIQTDGP
jgi:hypothetical protein